MLKQNKFLNFIKKHILYFGFLIFRSLKNISFNLAGKTYQQAAKGAFGEFKTAMKVFRNPRVYAGTFLNYTKKSSREYRLAM